METKLDLVLRDFAENPNLPKYRTNSILARGSAAAGATALGATLAAFIGDDPRILLGLAAAPAAGLMVGAKRSRDLERDQLNIDLKGRENIDKYKTYLNLTNQSPSPKLSVYALDGYLPKNEVSKLNEGYKKSLDMYPVDKSNPNSDNNKSERDKLRTKLIEDKVDLFLNNQELRKDKTISFKR